jgi:hypothetical protein
MTRLTKLLAASVLLGGLMFLAAELRPYYEHALFRRKEIAVVAVSALALAIYGGLVLALGVVTPAEVRAALRRSPRAKGAEPPAPDLP